MRAIKAMKTINIYTENELHRFAVSENDVHLTHTVCNDEKELATLFRSFCIPIATIQSPILRLTNTSCIVSLGMNDGSRCILFHTSMADQEIRRSATELFNEILQIYSNYKRQNPSIPANPVAVAPFKAADSREPSPQSITAAAAATSPSRPMTPTSEIRTSDSV